MFDHERSMAMDLGPALRAAAIADPARLQRIDRVYGVARFVNTHLYAVIAVGIGLILLVMTILMRMLWRLTARISARLRHR
jgi:hypothetical protein